ncbi:Septin-7 [Ilyodon furcidens]|uniref:Septin-7 n=1 Tax=Ilyodon furcidens TaxID=33524 RepID=A0ABV0URQ0_9TELE
MLQHLSRKHLLQDNCSCFMLQAIIAHKAAYHCSVWADQLATVGRSSSVRGPSTEPLANEEGAGGQVEQSKVLIKEGGVHLLLTIVDTPGFGDAVDNSNCWQPVTDHIDSKFEDFLNAESRVNRRQMPDSRVHCCLYFIAPSGHGLKPLDTEFMKRLHEKVNIIPLIAKADTMTPEECQQFKKQIMKEIHEHKIKIYDFPETDVDEEMKMIRKIKDRLPLAVVGSNTIIEVNGKRVRGRQYPWGVAEVENGDHCDFTILRNMLIRTHMQDLKDVTNNVHYENYRSRKLAAVTYNGIDNNKNKGQLTKPDTPDGM